MNIKDLKKSLRYLSKFNIKGIVIIEKKQYNNLQKHSEYIMDGYRIVLVLYR